MLNFNKLDKNGQLGFQKYLKTESLSTVEKQTLFSLRSHNLNCKSNFPSAFEDMSCRTCGDKNVIENEIHSLECSSVIDIDMIDETIQFKHIFGNLEEQIKAVKYYIKIIRKRNLLLELQQNC